MKWLLAPVCNGNKSAYWFASVHMQPSIKCCFSFVCIHVLFILYSLTFATMSVMKMAISKFKHVQPIAKHLQLLIFHLMQDRNCVWDLSTTIGVRIKHFKCVWLGQSSDNTVLSSSNRRDIAECLISTWLNTLKRISGTLCTHSAPSCGVWKA